MNKLIKISETHYIVVNNSEIKKGDLCYDKEGNPGYNNIKYIVKCLRTDSNSYWNKYCKKITHSTQPLESNNLYRKLDFINIKPLSLLEVEELIYGYNVQTMAKQQTIIDEFNSEKSYVNGFNAHKEIVKDKLLSIQLYSNNNHLEWIYNRMIEVHGENPNYDYMIAFKKIIQSLSPPTEWDVTFDEQGKLKLV
jgi:hypothetical protein